MPICSLHNATKKISILKVFKNFKLDKLCTERIVVEIVGDYPRCNLLCYAILRTIKGVNVWEMKNWYNKDEIEQVSL